MTVKELIKLAIELDIEKDIMIVDGTDYEDIGISESCGGYVVFPLNREEVSC